MASQKVVNNPLGSYPVAVDRAATGEQRQAVGIDIGAVSGGVLTQSRVSASNPLPTTGVITGSPTVDITKYGGTATTLGQKAMAASVPVVLSSDQSAVPVSGSVTVTQATGTNLHTVLDSGVLTSITNALPAGTNSIGKLGANSGIDIGDVTINNASGGSAVNIQDGGNSITVDTADGAVLSITGSVTASLISDVKVPNGAVSSDAIYVAARDSAGNANPFQLYVPGDAQNYTGIWSLLTSAVLKGYNGSTFDLLRSTTANGLVVDVSRVVGTVTTTATTTAAALTAAAPTAASVGVASAQILASATYKRVELVNTSANTISIGLGSAAVLNSGMTMIGSGSTATIEGPFTHAVNAIASVAASNLAIQAFT